LACARIPAESADQALGITDIFALDEKFDSGKARGELVIGYWKYVIGRSASFWLFK
jgi:hypothetical protein